MSRDLVTETKHDLASCFCQLLGNEELNLKLENHCFLILNSCECKVTKYRRSWPPHLRSCRSVLKSALNQQWTFHFEKTESRITGDTNALKINSYAWYEKLNMGFLQYRDSVDLASNIHKWKISIVFLTGGLWRGQKSQDGNHKFHPFVYHRCCTWARDSWSLFYKCPWVLTCSRK